MAQRGQVGAVMRLDDPRLRAESSSSDAHPLVAAFDAYYSDIRRFAAAQLGTATADDIAAETFERAVRNWERFDPGRGQLRPWLFGIAANVAREAARSRRSADNATAKLMARPTVGADEGDPYGQVDRFDFILRELGRLRPTLREAVLLVGVFEFTYEEAAIQLGVPPGTVASRVSKARKRLRPALEHSRRGSEVSDHQSAGNRS